MTNLDPNTQETEFEEVKDTPQETKKITAGYKKWLIVAIAGVVIVLIGYLVFFSGSSQEPKKETKKDSGPVPPVALPVDSTWRVKLDSLQIAFENFKNATNEKFDSLAAPRWLIELDKNTVDGGKK